VAADLIKSCQPTIAFSWPLAPGQGKLAAGVLILIAGAWLNIWADGKFRREGTAVCPFSPVHTVIVRGPYVISRNPMYLGFVFVSAGVSLLTGVWINLLAPIALMAWLHFVFVLPEEAFLRNQLGSPYEAYRAKRPRWFLMV
jgi:protein-S-isoprenylcysteine O-methyltransferase Ste14